MKRLSHLTLMVAPEEKEQIRVAAKLAGISVSRFVIAASEQKAAWALGHIPADIHQPRE
jgi:uncharacterized protein (DUF1778 family)